MSLSKTKSKASTISKVFFLNAILLEIIAIIALVVDVSTSTIHTTGLAGSFAVLVGWIAIAAFCLLFLSRFQNTLRCEPLMIIPVGISLTLYLYFLITNLQFLQQTIEEVKWYSTIFNKDISIWRWILYFTIEYGPTAIILIALFYAGWSCLRRKQKTKAISGLLFVAATVQLLSAIQSFSQSLPIYLNEFGFDSVLYGISSSLARIIVLFGLAILFIPKFTDSLSSGDFL